MHGALLRPQHRRDRYAGRGEHLDRAIAVEAAHAAASAALHSSKRSSRAA